MALIMTLAACVGEEPPRPDDPSLEEGGTHPVVFAPGVLSTTGDEGYATFTPDGRTVYFVRYEAFGGDGLTTIVHSTFEDDVWSEPEPAPFSGDHPDHMPFVSPDGSHLYFIAKRSASSLPRDDYDLWRVPLQGEPSNAERLGDSVNSTANEYGPSLDRAGNLYFASDRDGGYGSGDLYRADRSGSEFSPAVNLGDTVNGDSGEWGTAVAPDGSFLIFESSGRPENVSFSGDLYVAFREGEGWSSPRNFGEPVNSTGSEPGPRLSPDGRYLFFASNRGDSLDLYRVFLAPLLNDAR